MNSTAKPIPFGRSMLREHRHVCAFFSSAVEEYDALVPFICDGINCGQRAHHILPSQHREDHLNWLRSAGIDVENAIKSRQLEVEPLESTYLRTGRFNMDDMIVVIQEALKAGAEFGFPLTRLIAHAADRLGLRLDTATLRDAAAEIEWRKTSRLSVEQYAARSRPLPTALPMDRMADLQRAYEDLKDERRQLDFEDVLLAAAGMIEAEPRVAQQVREQYRFFVVDEYQDVSPLQHDLLDEGGRLVFSCLTRAVFARR